jgi:hypothetical protein
MNAIELKYQTAETAQDADPTIASQVAGSQAQQFSLWA